LLKEAEAFAAQQVTAKKPASSITCVKGTLTKKLSGPNAKCPKGYKKK
jgi:hypothetical protein